MFRRALLCSVISTTISVGQAAEFSGSFFFGDSLTDNGSYAAFVPNGLGRFTTNPGPVWSERVSAAFGAELFPATAGGRNFAQGGARVTRLPGVPASNPLTVNALPVSGQISAYLGAAGSADPNALYVVWAGANDVFQALDPVQPEAADPVNYLIVTASGLVDQITRLQAAGARYVLVPNLPDGGLTPFGTALGLAGAAAVSGLFDVYNQALFGTLAASGVQVVPLDVFTMLREVVANPARYGLQNVTDRACGATAALLCGPADQVVLDANLSFLFADDVHPTTAGHALIGDYALSVLRAPAAISLLAETPLDTRAALFRTIYDQATLAATDRSSNFHVWGNLGGSQLRYESSLAEDGVTGEPVDYEFGVDYRVASPLTVGVAVGSNQLRADFSGRSRWYRQEERALALYAAYRSGPWHLAAVAAAGELDFETQRSVALGPAVRSVPGSTSGSNRSLGILAGYEFASGPVRHGPVAGFHLQRVKVDGFRENAPAGESATAMFFDEQQRDSRVGSLGYQFSSQAGFITPYARVTFDYEFEEPGREVGAGLQNLPANRFALPAVTPDRNYATVVIGIGLRPVPATSLNFVLSSRVGQDNVRADTLQATLNVGF